MSAEDEGVKQIAPKQTMFGPYPGIVQHIHDGDTLTIDLDLGFGIWQTTLRCRLYGINAPELKTAEGVAARDFLTALVPVGAAVSVVSHGWDKYGGRFDGTVTYEGIDLSAAMLSSGHAVPLTL
jgi:endonuclease YncB( thermonuclease family)